MPQQIDIKLTPDEAGLWDINLGTDGDLEIDGTFGTTIAMCLYCERRALPSEMGTAQLRRGWIGNILASVPGFEMGSKLWIYSQARLTPETISGTQTVSQESVEWMVEDEIIDSISVNTFQNGTEAIDAELTFTQKSGKVEKRYFRVWELTSGL
jgi:phage gp46-like protein